MNDETRPQGPGSEIAATASALIVNDGSDNPAVVAKLWRLRDRHAYFTRSEVEAALGIPSPRGQWQCPGQFGPDGRWKPCCEAAA